MLPGIKQSSCAELRYQSESLWRRADFLADALIAGQLRTEECDVTAHMRLLAAAATREVEDYLKIGMQLQVRELRLNRFPFRRDPIKLDYRTVWNASEWEGFASGSSSSGQGDAEESIAELFGENDPPILITYGGCCGTDEEVLDPEKYTLKRSDQGDAICLVDCDCWPCNCSGQGCDYVRVRYVTGFFSSKELQADNPKLILHILSTFGYLYENPEMMSSSGNVYDSSIIRSRLSSKWRV